MEYIKDILDQIQLWHLCIAVYIVAVTWLAYEYWKAPTMPDDYDKEYPN